MTIRIALNHQTHYRYERPVSVGPQVVRLRPAPHCRTPILSYSLKIQPADHFVNWQQDPHGNFQARIVFPEKVRELKIDVDLIADMSDRGNGVRNQKALIGSRQVICAPLDVHGRGRTIIPAKSKG